MPSPNLTRSLVLFLVIAAAITVLIRFPIWQVHAGNTITVNSSSDAVNSSDGFCTLREAISAANNNAASGATPGECAAGSSSGSDTIVMSAVTGTINLASALPDISTDMAINGPGADVLTVQRSTGGAQFRIFKVNSGTTASISGFTISNGDVTTLVDARGGGLKNEGTLTLSDCKIFGNSAAVGGGIANLGTSLTLTNCNVGGTSPGQANTATSQAGGLYQFSGTLTMMGGAISGNSGGGLLVSDTIALLNGVTIANNNNVGSAGAGISALSGGMTPTVLNVVNSLITGNVASSGAGVANQGATVTLINTTISGNSTVGAGGGMTAVSGGTTTLTNVTITNNRCNTGNVGLTGGGFFVPTGFTEGTFKNTIIAGNFRGASPSTTSDDITGSVDPASSSSLIGNGSGMTGVSNGSNGNQVGSALPINALLASLANNGGPTMTHALLPGSPAINAGSNTNLPADTFDLDGDSNTAEPLPVDQRGTGFNRVVNTTVDIGAFESRGFSISATSGTPQSTTIANTFATPFSATVSSSFGEPVANGIITFVAPVGGPTGTFSGSVSTMTAATNSSGVATATTFLANGTAGSYIVTAGGNGISSAAQFNLTNLKATTTLLLGSSTNPSNVGQNVVFSATVFSSGTGPTGTVQFMDGSTALGAPVNCGPGPSTICLASLSTSTLAVGTHAISAIYSGDANTSGSSGALAGGQLVGSVVAFDLSNYSVNESDGAVSIRVNRTGATGGIVTVSYASNDTGASTNCASVNSLASSRCDFTTALGTLVFNAGETFKPITVLVNRDSISEGPEAFTVGLSALTGPAIFATPTTTTVTINDSPPIGSNAIDDSANFVRQHYHDFLNREPDASGLQFWTNEIESCGTDTACREVKRINVSAAFFLSIEFQQTGYLVERLYKTAYGDAQGNSTFPTPHTLPVPIVRFNEFLADTQEIGRGVVVGQAGWEQQLENNKVAFINLFVQRSRFTTPFGSIGNTQFVDTLNGNAGSPLSQSERDQLIADLNNSAKTRAQALRVIAEHSNLVTNEFNRAFVLMQFFGYLRRNPNDAPELGLDYTGYDFWLTKLNQFGGNFQNAEMVKAFITSDEYRHRFGP